MKSMPFNNDSVSKVLSILCHQRASRSKRPYLLLEVLIAFVLVVLCFLPLIYPHLALLKETKTFIKWEEHQRLHQLIFAEIVIRLHQNTFAWESIVQGTTFPIEGNFLKEIDPTLNLSDKGTFSFKIKKSKTAKDQLQGYYLLEVLLTYPQKSQQVSFDLFLERNVK